MTRRVRDLMHPGLITCRADALLGQVAAMLTQHRIHALVVADRDNRPLGIISDFDLLAAEWLSTDADSLGAMRGEAAEKMIENPHHRLVVVDPDQPEAMPLGIISSYDIVNEMARPGSV